MGLVPGRRSPHDQYGGPHPGAGGDLAGLPPAFIDVGTVEPVPRRGHRLWPSGSSQAGVPCELHVNAGAYHGSEAFAPDAALSQRIWARRIDALKRALA